MLGRWVTWPGTIRWSLNVGADRLGLVAGQRVLFVRRFRVAAVRCDAFESGPGGAGSPVPEPTTLLLFGSGLAAGAAVLRRRIGRSKAA